MEPGDAYLTVKVRGPATVDNLVHLISRVHLATKDTRTTRVLVDLSEIGGRPPFTDQFRIGEMAALRLSHLDRVASVVRAEDITRTSEKVAGSLGLDLRVFASLQEAQAWLRGA